LKLGGVDIWRFLMTYEGGELLWVRK